MIDNSGPAYPQLAGPAGFRQKWSDGFGGLSKREAFAQTAMGALSSNSTLDLTVEETARLACMQADALLEALEISHEQRSV